MAPNDPEAVKKFLTGSPVFGGLEEPTISRVLACTGKAMRAGRSSSFDQASWRS
jgi:hypothetical protein